MGIREAILSSLEHMLVASAVCYFALFLVGYFIPSIWYLVFSILVSFVMSDLILNVFIHVGERHSIFSENDLIHRGHSYIVFLVGIIASTILSSVIADLFFRGYQQNSDWFQTVFTSDFLAIFLVFVDLYLRFCTSDQNS